MNDIVERILKIDRDTADLREKTESLLEAERENNRKVVAAWIKENEQNMRDEAESVVTEIQNKTEEELAQLRKDSKEDLQRLQTYFDENKQGLADSLMKKMGL